MIMRASNIIPEKYLDFYTTLTNSWSKETSPYWTKENIEKGECAITSVLFQKFFGGKMMRAIVNGESHYWNIDKDGIEVDFTRAQFALPLTIENPGERSAEYVLSYPETLRRYQILEKNFLKALIP